MSQAHSKIRRSYRTDFEAYSGAEEVAIHIGSGTGIESSVEKP